MKAEQAYRPFNWITSDGENLPPNVKTISATTLTGDVVAEAVSLMTFPTNVVQIKVPENQVLKAGLSKFLNDHDVSYFADPETEDGIIRTPQDVIDGMQGYFNQHLVDPKYSAEERNVLEEIKKIGTEMTQAVGEVWPDCFIGDILWGNGETDVAGEALFHEHAAMLYKDAIHPGYYLNYAASNIGTIFEDARGQVWAGQGWSHFLFATSGHDELVAASHSFPSQEFGFKPEARATLVTQIYPRENRKSLSLD